MSGEPRFRNPRAKYSSPRRLAARKHQRLVSRHIEAVALFSEAWTRLLDRSTFLRENPTSRLMVDRTLRRSRPRRPTERRIRQMSARFPGRTKLVQVRVSQRPAKNIESSLLRFQSFFGLGIYAASEMPTVPSSSGKWNDRPQSPADSFSQRLVQHKPCTRFI